LDLALPRPALIDLSPQAVQGTVQDAQQRPLARALVFLQADSEVTAKTDDKGAFVLDAVPPGLRTLVVVVGDIGQEFDVNVHRESATDAGKLVYAVPEDLETEASRP